MSIKKGPAFCCNDNRNANCSCIDKRHTFICHWGVTFDWNEQKNEDLKAKRNISFEEIVVCIHENRIVDVLDHPNPQKYPDQHTYVIWCKNYAYAVPNIKDEEKQEIFLKTIYPSRIYTRRYRKDAENDE